MSRDAFSFSDDFSNFPTEFSPEFQEIPSGFGADSTNQEKNQRKPGEFDDSLFAGAIGSTTTSSAGGATGTGIPDAKWTDMRFRNTLSLDEESVYAEFFRQLDAQGTEILAVDGCVAFFQKSGLDNVTLGRIWEKVCPSSQSMNKECFYKAMRYIALVQSGMALSHLLGAGNELFYSQSPIPLPQMMSGSANSTVMTTSTQPLVPMSSKNNPHPHPHANAHSSGSATPPEVCPLLTPQELNEHLSLFATVQEGNGRVSGGRVVPLFRRSGLNDTQLGNVWQLVDRNSAGSLSGEEFAVALHVIRFLRTHPRGVMPVSVESLLPVESAPQSLEPPAPHPMAANIAHNAANVNVPNASNASNASSVNNVSFSQSAQVVGAMTNRLQQTRDHLSHLEIQHHDQADILRVKENERAAEEALVEGLQKEVSEREREVHEQRVEIEKIRSSIGSAKSNKAALQAELSSLLSAYLEGQKQLSHLQSHTADKDLSLAELQEAIASEQAKMGDLHQELKIAQQRLESVTADVTAANESLRKARDESETLQEEIDKARMAVIAEQKRAVQERQVVMEAEKELVAQKSRLLVQKNALAEEKRRTEQLLARWKQQENELTQIAKEIQDTEQATQDWQEQATLVEGQMTTVAVSGNKQNGEEKVQDGHGQAENEANPRVATEVAKIQLMEELFHTPPVTQQRLPSTASADVEQKIVAKKLAEEAVVVTEAREKNKDKEAETEAEAEAEEAQEQVASGLKEHKVGPVVPARGSSKDSTPATSDGEKDHRIPPPIAERGTSAQYHPPEIPSVPAAPSIPEKKHRNLELELEKKEEEEGAVAGDEFTFDGFDAFDAQFSTDSAPTAPTTGGVDPTGETTEAKAVVAPSQSGEDSGGANAAFGDFDDFGFDAFPSAGTGAAAFAADPFVSVSEQPSATPKGPKGGNDDDPFVVAEGFEGETTTTAASFTLAADADWNLRDESPSTSPAPAEPLPTHNPFTTSREATPQSPPPQSDTFNDAFDAAFDAAFDNDFAEAASVFAQPVGSEAMEVIVAEADPDRVTGAAGGAAAMHGGDGMHVTAVEEEDPFHDTGDVEGFESTVAFPEEGEPTSPVAAKEVDSVSETANPHANGNGNEGSGADENANKDAFPADGADPFAADGFANAFASPAEDPFAATAASAADAEAPQWDAFGAVDFSAAFDESQHTFG